MIGRRHARLAEDVAPYVLGALPPAEAAAFEEHARACAECQHELAELRSGVEALARSVEPLAPPASLRARVLEELASEPSERSEPSETSEAAGRPSREAAAAGPEPESKRGWGGVLAGLRARLARLGAGGRRPLPARSAAVLATGMVAVVAGGLAGWALRGIGDDEGEVGPRTVTASVDRARLPSASAHMTIPPEGEDPVLRLAGLRGLGPERSYEIWVQRGGEIAPGPLFEPAQGGAAMMGIPGRAEDIEAVYVTRERAGGAPAPTEAPLIRVSLGS